MQIEHKINSSLFSALNENIKHPFLVLDQLGNVLSFNKEAGKLLSLKAEINLFDILEDESAETMNSLLEEIYSGGKSIEKVISLKLKNKEEVKAGVHLSYYQEDSEMIIFCSLNIIDLSLGSKNVGSLKIKSSELKDLIHNKNVLKLIEKVKSLYPFTFIGRENFRKEIDKLDEFFWLKNSEGNFEIINKKLAKGIGLKPSQLEGKPESSFIPAYLFSLYSSIEKYIKDSHNTIIIEGIPLKGISSSEEYQTIEIPLLDADKNLTAVIGLAQIPRKQEKKISAKELMNSSAPILNYLPKKIAFVDNKGIIKHTSGEFIKLFSDDFSDLRNYDYKKIFPLEISKKIGDFLKSSSDEEKTDIENAELFQQHFKYGASLILNKIKGEDGHFEGASIILEDKVFNDDIEKFLIKRGRMYDVLVQNNPEPIFIYDKDNLSFLEVNSASLKLYGYNREEFLKMDLTDLYTPEDIQTLLDSSSAAEKEGKFAGPFRHKKKDGSSVFVEICKISFKFNESDAHFNIIRDVTEKLELQKKTQLFKTAFDNSSNLIFITDTTGFINYINKSVLNYLGYDKNEIEKSSFTSLVADSERGTINTTVFQSHLKDEVTISLELKKKSGEFIQTELTANPILDYKGEVDSFIIIGKVEPQQAEQQEPKEIIKEVEVIKEVIVEKPVYIETGKPAAEEAVLSQGEGVNVNMLSNIFHEILTPINVILGFVQELIESVKEPNGEQKEAANIIDQNRTNLLNTMNSIMEYTNLQKTEVKLNPEELKITDVLEKLQKEIENISSIRNIELAYGKISSSLKFVTDKKVFQDLIIQLIKIIAQLSKEKKIYFSAYPIDDDKFIIPIKDGYAALSKQLHYSLNMLFEQPENISNKDFGVSKLTVSLIKKLLDMLNGSFQNVDRDGKIETGFVFPMELKVGEKPYAEKPEPFSAIEENIFDESDDDGEKEEPQVYEEEKIVQEVVEPEEEKIIQEVVEPEEETIETEEIVSDEDKFNSFVEEEFEQIEKEMDEAIVEAEDEQPAEEEIEVPAAQNSAGVDLSRMNCLYIEDQVDSQILFKVQMKELKEIKYAVSFEEALPLLDSHHFDFIVMDINLQGEYNGLDALKIIHKMPGYETIPIIAVTAYVLPGDKEKFIATGFNDFISKPIFREKMIDSLEKIFLMQF